MRRIALLPVVAMCGFASGQTPEPSPVTTVGQLTVTGPAYWNGVTAFNTPILTCTMKDDHHVDKCTLAEGHTLEEAMQVMIDQQKMNSDELMNDTKAVDDRLQQCIGIAERENKALRRCSDGLNNIAKMLRKDAEK